MQMLDQDADVSVYERDNIRDVNDIKLNVKINASSQPDTVASPTEDDTMNNRLRYEEESRIPVKNTGANKTKAKASRTKPGEAPKSRKVQNVMKKPKHNKKDKKRCIAKGDSAASHHY